LRGRQIRVDRCSTAEKFVIDLLLVGFVQLVNFDLRVVLRAAR
jgi:hypothetical protein